MIPKNLTGLLNFCIKEGENQNFTEMDPERAKFLREALKSIDVDIVGELKKLIKTVIEKMNSEKEEDVATVTDCLEQIHSEVENIDMANIFIQIDGLILLRELSSSNNVNLKTSAANILAVVVQNNEKAQLIALENKIVSTLVENIIKSQELKLIKANLLALSCCVRNSPKCLLDFVSSEKYNEVIKAIAALYEEQKENEKKGLLSSIFTKFSFFTFAICGEMDDSSIVKFRTPDTFSSIVRVMSNVKPMEDFLIRSINRLAVDVPRNADSSDYEAKYDSFKADIVPTIPTDTMTLLKGFIQRKEEELAATEQMDIDEDVQNSIGRVKKIFF